MHGTPLRRAQRHVGLPEDDIRLRHAAAAAWVATGRAGAAAAHADHGSPHASSVRRQRHGAHVGHLDVLVPRGARRGPPAGVAVRVHVQPPQCARMRPPASPPSPRGAHSVLTSSTPTARSVARRHLTQSSFARDLRGGRGWARMRGAEPGTSPWLSPRRAHGQLGVPHGDIRLRRAGAALWVATGTARAFALAALHLRDRSVAAEHHRPLHLSTSRGTPGDRCELASCIPVRFAHPCRGPLQRASHSSVPSRS